MCKSTRLKFATLNPWYCRRTGLRGKAKLSGVVGLHPTRAVTIYKKFKCHAPFIMNLFPNMLAAICLYIYFLDFSFKFKHQGIANASLKCHWFWNVVILVSCILSSKSYRQKNTDMKADKNQPYCDQNFENHLIHSNLNVISAFQRKFPLRCILILPKNKSLFEIENKTWSNLQQGAVPP